MIRDDEFKRLLKYAAALGIKVSITNSTARESAYWLLDGSEIVINNKYQESKTEKILSLIHELGHHLWYVHERDRKPDLKFEEAIYRQNLHEDEGDVPPTKKQREKIHQIEVAGTQYWEAIYKETMLSFPKWKLYAAMEMDTWVYERFAKTGKFPTIKERRKARNLIRKKHRG